MSAPLVEPTVAEFRALMRRASESGDRCSCGATFRTGHWDVSGGVLGHMHFSRFRDVAEHATEARPTGIRTR